MFLTHSNIQADRAVEEMERKFDQKLAECKEEAKLQLMHIQEEHAALVCKETYAKSNSNFWLLAYCI